MEAIQHYYLLIPTWLIAMLHWNGYKILVQHDKGTHMTIQKIHGVDMEIVTSFMHE